MSKEEVTAESVIHVLKTWPEYFKLVISGEKTFELRKNDRDFKVGDRLDLMEFDPIKNEFTGSHCHRFITHILSDNSFMDMQGNVILSFQYEPLPEHYASLKVKQELEAVNKELEDWLWETNSESVNNRILDLIEIINSKLK